VSTPHTLVIGAGIVGAAAVADLVRRGHAVTAADNRRDVLDRVAAGLPVTAVELDIRDGEAATRLMAEHDAVVSAVPFSFGPELARMALAARRHYLDFGGNPTVVKAQLGLHDAAVDADVALVPDCGLAPGLANVIADGMIEEATPGYVDRVAIRVGALPAQPSGPLGYALEFSAAGLINEYAEPCEVIADGAAARVEPLTGFEEVAWDGWGPLEAFHTAGGTSTMCEDHAGRVGSLDYKTLRYPGHGRIFAALRWLGFFATDAVEGVGVSPRAMLLDRLARSLPHDEPDVVLIRIEVVAAGREDTISIVARPSGGFSALARTTALPATALCDLLVRGAVRFRGAAAMHRAVTSPVLMAELDELGLETVSGSAGA
jgi:lysine 6-dehydrogenase